MPTISLEGSWVCQPDWEDASVESVPPNLFPPGGSLPAKVPGTVHTDLLAAGKIPDPFHDDFEDHVQWVAEVGWRYHRTFDLDDIFLSSKSVELCLEGLDTFAHIAINDVDVGSTDNMFIPHRFEVGHLLRANNNTIEVVLASPLQSIRNLEKSFAVPETVMSFPRVYARKAQYSFGWDWGPRLATSGIWRPIVLTAFDQIKLQRFHIKQTMSPAMDHAAVSVDIECAGHASQSLHYFAHLSGPGCDIFLKNTSRNTRQTFVFDVDSPQLWWPNGLGKQPLYEVTISVEVSGVRQFSATRQIGLRRVRLHTEPDPEGESFCLHINDVPVFCKGANWIPSDSFIPRITEAKLRALVTAARDANMNMIRIWGGGIYESDSFYSMCDELGLMIWQDFMFACATYPGHDRFLANVEHEVKTIVRQLRDHPCIVVWCGNNENEQDWYKYLNRPYSEMVGHQIFDEVIPAVLSEEDPSRPYRQSSPFGGDDPNSESIGTRHQWNIWSNWASPTSVFQDRSRFVTEFGFQAPACLQTWSDYIREDELWPQSRMLEHHNKQIAGQERLYRYLAEQFKVPVTFEDFVYKTQVVQAEALKVCVEHWRTRKFYTSGSIIWQLNDCWPVTSWSLIDYELRAKAAYWYSKRFFAPILLVIRKNGEFLDFHAVNDTLDDCSCRLVISVFGWYGKLADIREQTCRVTANESVLLTSIKLTELDIPDASEAYVRAQLLKNNAVAAENRYFLARYKHLPLRAPNLESDPLEGQDGNYSLDLVSDRFVKALCVELPEREWHLSDNFLDMDAGEKNRVDIRPLLPGRKLQASDIAMQWIQ